jgi:hypothetical protein
MVTFGEWKVKVASYCKGGGFHFDFNVRSADITISGAPSLCAHGWRSGVLKAESLCRAVTNTRPMYQVETKLDVGSRIVGVSTGHSHFALRWMVANYELNQRRN